MDSSITWSELVINCLLLLDFLRSGSSSEPQNTGQPGEEEQEEMRDTLDPPEDAWDALNAWEDTLDHQTSLSGIFIGRPLFGIIGKWPKVFKGCQWLIRVLYLPLIKLLARDRRSDQISKSWLLQLSQQT